MLYELNIHVHVCNVRVSCAEEEKKRKHESSLSAVGFSYNNMATSSASREETEEPPLLACYPQRQEHPPTSSVDLGEGEDKYVPPAGLIIPNNIKTVSCMHKRSWHSLRTFKLECRPS